MFRLRLLFTVLPKEVPSLRFVPLTHVYRLLYEASLFTQSKMGSLFNGSW